MELSMSCHPSESLARRGDRLLPSWSLAHPTSILTPRSQPRPVDGPPGAAKTASVLEINRPLRISFLSGLALTGAHVVVDIGREVSHTWRQPQLHLSTRNTKDESSFAKRVRRQDGYVSQESEFRQDGERRHRNNHTTPFVLGPRLQGLQGSC